METISSSEIILTKIQEFYRINQSDSDEEVKRNFTELFRQWSNVVNAGDDANDDELFHLNAARGFFHQRFIFAMYKQCFNTDHEFTRNTLQLCLQFLANHIEIFRKDNSINNRTFVISNVRFIMDILSTMTAFLWYSDIELFNEEVFIAMREYVDQDATNSDLTDGILSLIWSLSDDTPLVLMLLKADYAQSLYQWIKDSRTKFREDKQNSLINILQNMSRHDDGIEQFNRLKMLDMLASVEFEEDLSYFLTNIRVLLTDRNQIELISIEFVNKVVENIIQAGEDERYRHEGAHIGELLTILAKLFYNDEILQMVLETKPSIIDLFISLLMKIYPTLNCNSGPLENFTCVLLLNILCCISCHQEYSEKIFDNEQLMNVIRKAVTNETNFADTFMPRTMKSSEQAATEILKSFNNHCI